MLRVAFGLAIAALVAHAQGIEPIRVGFIAPTTGPAAEWGSLTVNGARLALEEVNQAGGIRGRPLALKQEDDQSTNPGAVLAFTRLSAEGVVAVIGPIRSTQIQAMSPSIARSGIPTLIGGSDPSLTRVNNRWLFRIRPNDIYSSRVIADFGVHSLKAKKWAVVYSTDAYGSGGAKALAEALKESGVTPVYSQGFTNNSQDFTSMILAIRKSGADLISGFIGVPADLAIFARQLRQQGVTVPILSGATASAIARNLAGSTLHGSYAVIDFAQDATPVTRAFAAKYRARYGSDPDFFSSWTYDAVHILAMALEKAGSTDPEAIRSAILSIRGYEGTEGTYAFDRNGDGVHGYSVLRNDDGRLVFIRRVDFLPE